MSESHIIVIRLPYDLPDLAEDGTDPADMEVSLQDAVSSWQFRYGLDLEVEVEWREYAPDYRVRHPLLRQG